MPSKKSLQEARHNLALAKQGHDLLDKKRQVLLLEFSNIKNAATQIHKELTENISLARYKLTLAQMAINTEIITKISDYTRPTYIQIQSQSTMGVIIPKISILSDLGNEKNKITLPYNLNETTSTLDEAMLAWKKVGELIIKLAEAQITVYRLNMHILQAQKRAAALNNITIPTLEARIKYIQNQLEERERDELARLKVAKK